MPAEKDNANTYETGWVSKIARYECSEKETVRRIERCGNGERRDERKGGNEEEAKEEGWSGGWFGRKVGSWMNERGLVRDDGGGSLFFHVRYHVPADVPAADLRFPRA